MQQKIKEEEMRVLRGDTEVTKYNLQRSTKTNLMSNWNKKVSTEPKTSINPIYFSIIIFSL
jgi:hypothetical protein